MVNYAELTWIFAEHLIKWKPYLCVSVPGQSLRNLARMLTISTAPQPLYVYWMYDNYQQYNYYTMVSPTLCRLKFPIFWNFDYCLNFSSSSRYTSQHDYYYLFFRQNLSNYDTHQNTDISWHEVFLICGILGGSLPILASKNELGDLIALIKLSPVDALYISLTQDTRTVRPL